MISRSCWQEMFSESSSCPNRGAGDFVANLQLGLLNLISHLLNQEHQSAGSDLRQEAVKTESSKKAIISPHVFCHQEARTAWKQTKLTTCIEPL